MKILHLISTLDTGGAEITLLKLVMGMGAGFDNIVVSMTDIGPVGKKMQEKGINVKALNMKKGFPDPRGIIKLFKIVYKYNPDIIQGWLYHANLMGLLFAYKRKCVWNIRCSYMDLNSYGIIYRLIVKIGAYASRFTHLTIVNSFAGKLIHEAINYRPKRWEIIPNGIDTEKFRPNPIAGKRFRDELKIPQNAFVIGLVARLDFMKDHSNFFSAAKILLKEYPEVHFILAGRGITTDNSTVRYLISGIQRTENIHLIGERNDIHDVYSALNIGSSSSCGEGFPNTVGETMAAGVPCVVTDVGDSARLVNNTGVVVPQKNPDALAQAWKSMIDAGNGEIRKLGKRARKHIREHYSLAPMVEKYEEVYACLGQGSRD